VQGSCIGTAVHQLQKPNKARDEEITLSLIHQSLLKFQQYKARQEGHPYQSSKRRPPVLISTEINFIGNLVGTYNDLAELMTLTAQGKVKLHTATYPLDAANDAIHDLDSGRLRGRGILVP
jgi:hypothetical protein